MTGEELKARRMRAKVSRQEIAVAMGLTYSFVQRVEDGWRIVPEDYPARFHAALTAITGQRHESTLAECQPAEVA